MDLQQPNIALPLDAIPDFCARWGIVKFALFGSVLRTDFNENSDIDVLVTFAPNAHPTLFTLVEITDELEALFGRSVDVITRPSVEQSANYIRREAILSTAQVIYAT